MPQRNGWPPIVAQRTLWLPASAGRTTGLIIGGISGGVLGHIIAPGGSKTLGTIIGAGAGALIGRAIDDGDVVCR